MSWYTSELLPLGLYGPAAFLGMLVSRRSVDCAT